NDAPVGTSNSVSALEDTPYIFTVADFGFSDPGDVSGPNALANVKITTLPGAGTLKLNGNAVAALQFVSASDIAAGLLSFTAASNANGANYASFGFQVQDDGGTANLGVDLDSVVRTLTIDVAAVNDAPEVGAPFANPVATQDAPFAFTVPVAAFTDVDTSDTLTIAAALVSGGSLPSWLHFDAGTRSFSGTPANADVGTLEVRLTASDGSGATVSRDFSLLVSNVNDVPVLLNAIPDQTVAQDSPLKFTLAPDTFDDVDPGDTLTYAATLVSGSALPTWLAFDAATQTFSGTPDNAAVGDLAIRVSASDESGALVSADFTLRVTNVNDAPTLVHAIADQQATQDAAFGFSFAPKAFSDPDVGDTLAYAASRADGTALPAWLRFDPQTRSFSGTPANADVGATMIRVRATDTSGASAVGDFQLVVANVNDAPLLGAPMSPQQAVTGTALRFVLPDASFIDPDVGDTLRYTAALENGAALPAWLVFDSGTRSFGGNPGRGDVGQITVRVTATDEAGAGAQGLFTITVLPAAIVPPPSSQPPRAAPSVETLEETPVIEVPPTTPAAAPTLSAASTGAQSSAAAAEEPAENLGDSASAGVLNVPDVTVTVETAALPGTPAMPAVEAFSTSHLASRSDTVLATMVAPQFAQLSMSPLNQLMRGDDLTRRFEELQRQMKTQASDAHRAAVASSILITGGVSIGYVVWLVRGGVLMGSMLSALPAWQMIDPLPVLAASRLGAAARKGARKNEDATVERLFDEGKGARAGAAKSGPAVPARSVAGADSVRQAAPGSAKDPL
ncbi:MAG: putative Ig domain-containing protein, partial [Burkholderiaceae bacterium]